MGFLTSTTLYNLLRGPLVWVSMLVFLFGSVHRVRTLMLMAKNDKVVLPFISLKATVRSVAHWVIPFAARNWRRRPVLTIMAFIFHTGLVFTPLFLLSHNLLWRESWGLTWWTLPEAVADLMTLGVIVAGAFFLLRRLHAPEVRFVTDPSDYAILLLSVLPFVLGFLAYHQWLLPHQAMLNLHILAGEAMLVAIPFTRLGHMFTFFMTRAWIGSNFALWHSRDW